jgi:hypothetical protein
VATSLVWLSLPRLADGDAYGPTLDLCVLLVCVASGFRVLGSITTGEKNFPWWFYAPFAGLSPLWISGWLVPLLGRFCL